MDTLRIMMGAVVLMSMDGNWFADMGKPTYSEDYAYMLVHYSREEIVEWGEEWRIAAENLSDEVEELQDEIDNLTVEIAVLEAKVASLQEDLNGTEMLLNESLENETILRQQVDNLRRLLEETNETVDELEEDIEALEASVQRLQEDNDALKENITKLQDQLRAEQNNVTHLRWELENATDAYNQAVLDRDAAQREAEDARKDYDDLQARTLLVAIACLVAGMIIVVVVLKAMRRL